MGIIGAHMLLYTPEADALRSTLRDVFGFRFVDAGGGWLIFALPPSELGVHPAEGPTYDSGVRHQVSLMCDDIHATVAELRAKGIQIDGEPVDAGYGVTVMMTLPGGVKVQLYEPRHAMAIASTTTGAR
jgi:catechol 2,3-dioxygenase-like lactoylglutathione lyase family enzyme